MSIKSPLQNSIKSNCETQWMKASIDGNVKFAGEEAKDRLYEPKHKKKLVRVLTVVAYIFFVSLAAIMLSLYYVFLWNGNQKENMRHIVPKSSGYMSARCVYPPPGETENLIDRTAPSTALPEPADNLTFGQENNKEINKLLKKMI